MLYVDALIVPLHFKKCLKNGNFYYNLITNSHDIPYFMNYHMIIHVLVTNLVSVTCNVMSVYKVVSILYTQSTLK